MAIVREYLSEVKFADRKTTLLGATNPHVKKKKLLPFVTQYRQYHPALLTLKKIQWENDIASYTKPTTSKRNL